MERCEALELGPGPDEFINVAVELILNIITASIRLAPGFVSQTSLSAAMTSIPKTGSPLNEKNMGEE